MHCFYWFCVLLITQLACIIPLWAAGGGAGGGRGGSGGGGFGVSYPFGSRRTIAPVIGSSGVLFIVVVFAAATVWAITTNRRRLLMVVLLVRRGNDYTRKLRYQLQKADFSDQHGRTIALDKFLDTVKPEDILEGYSQQIACSYNASQMCRQAEQLWSQQLQIIGFGPSSFKLETPEEQIYFDEQAEHQTNSQTTPSEPLCLIGLVATVPVRNLSWYSGGEEAAEVALVKLRQQAPEAFYFFYTPGSNEKLPQEEATVLLRRLCAIK